VTEVGPRGIWNPLCTVRSLTYLTRTAQPNTCGRCALYARVGCPRSEYREAKLNRAAAWPPDHEACSLFEPWSGVGRRGRESSEKGQTGVSYTLDLEADVPPVIKPSGFYGDALTEPAWLPYRDDKGKAALRPSVIVVRKGQDAAVQEFYANGAIPVTGVFPAQTMTSLISVKGVKRLLDGEAVDPRAVDREIDEAHRRHLDMPEAERILNKRWAEGTYFYDCFDAYPLESILGVSESGKSRLCLLNLALCYHAVPMILMTEAGIFRSKEEDRSTLIVDEAEYLKNVNLHETIRLLLNASYSKYGGFVTRYDEDEKGRRVKRVFDLYSPMCIAGIGGLEGITLSRAFRLVMRRTDKDFPKANPDSYRMLRDSLYITRLKHAFEVRELYEKLDISHIVTARFEELFKPLFVMTEVFGVEDEWNILSDWCREYQENFRVEALNVAEEETVLACCSRLEPVQPDWYQLRDLADAVNAESASRARASSKHVSGILYRLGLTKRKKLHGVTIFYAPVNLVEEACKRIGLSPPDLLTPPSLPIPPDQRPEKAEPWLFKREESS